MTTTFTQPNPFTFNTFTAPAFGTGWNIPQTMQGQAPIAGCTTINPNLFTQQIAAQQGVTPGFNTPFTAPYAQSNATIPNFGVSGMGGIPGGTPFVPSNIFTNPNLTNANNTGFFPQNVQNFIPQSIPGFAGNTIPGFASTPNFFTPPVFNGGLPIQAPFNFASTPFTGLPGVNTGVNTFNGLQGYTPWNGMTAGTLPFNIINTFAGSPTQNLPFNTLNANPAVAGHDLFSRFLSLIQNPNTLGQITPWNTPNFNTFGQITPWNTPNFNTFGQITPWNTPNFNGFAQIAPWTTPNFSMIPQINPFTTPSFFGGLPNFGFQPNFTVPSAPQSTVTGGVSTNGIPTNGVVQNTGVPQNVQGNVGINREAA